MGEGDAFPHGEDTPKRNEPMKHFYSMGPPNRERSRLRLQIVAVLLLVSLLPLIAVFFGSVHLFNGLLMELTVAQHRGAVAARAGGVDLYLKERSNALKIAAYSKLKEQLATPEGVASLFRVLDEVYPGTFVDIGVIDGRGDHLAYFGPYSLQHKNYRDAKWFASTMAVGNTVSDVFLGFRNVPHCVIAVTRHERDDVWILRATVNNDALLELVQQIDVGLAGDAFIVNREGQYQTPPKKGEMLGSSGIAAPRFHRGVASNRLVLDGVEMLQTTAWINNGRWMMVVRQGEREIAAPARQAIVTGLLVAIIGVLMIVFTTWIATSHLTARIDRAVSERDAISRDLMRSAKLASLGELASGLAHEINNPLAVMSAEHTNIADAVGNLLREEIKLAEPVAIAHSVERCRRQIERCKKITMKMLKFGRHSAEVLTLTDIAPIIEEVVDLMQRQVRSEDIRISLKSEPNLPRLRLDGNDLEQVLVNLITNAIQAIQEARRTGEISVSVARQGPDIVISVADDGCGIPEDVLDHVFEPFFTTKPVGTGTGLGLSVCHGIVRSFGGTIQATSRREGGTAVFVSLPIPADSKNSKEAS